MRTLRTLSESLRHSTSVPFSLVLGAWYSFPRRIMGFSSSLQCSSPSALLPRSISQRRQVGNEPDLEQSDATKFPVGATPKNLKSHEKVEAFLCTKSLEVESPVS